MATKESCKRFTFKDFERMFPTDEACLDWLRDHLYPEGIYCQKCERVTKHHKVISRKSYSCDYCGHHVHPTAGTIFHKSSTSLRTWFHAIYLMASTRCGVSAKQIQRHTGVTYKTAWRMFRQIRKLLKDSTGPLGGTTPVEMDETYMGGRRKYGVGRPMRGDKKKTIVVGMVERRGRVKALTADNIAGTTLLDIAKAHILPNSTVFTDELHGYSGLSYMNRGYVHRRIKHSAKVYVVGDVHTNCVEGFWSLVKRGVGGVYHQVSQKYLQSYLDEYSFRYNHRRSSDAMFEIFLSQIAFAPLASRPSQNQPW